VLTHTLTLTGSHKQLQSALAAFASTEETGTLSDSSQIEKAQPISKTANKSGKPTLKETVAAKQSSVEDFETTEDSTGFDASEASEEADLDDAFGPAEEEKNYSLAEVQKLMGAYAKAKTPAAAQKLLTKFKVKKLAQLPQVKLNELAKIIEL